VAEFFNRVIPFVQDFAEAAVVAALQLEDVYIQPELGYGVHSLEGGPTTILAIRHALFA
jgi:hypothetical protein